MTAAPNVGHRRARLLLYGELMSKSTPTTRSFRLPARLVAILVAVGGVALVLVAVVGSTMADGAAEEARMSLESAQEASQLANTDLQNATTALAVAQKERDSADLKASIAKGAYSFTHSRFESQAYYERLMQESADAYDEVAEAHTAAEAVSADTDRTMTLETSSLNARTEAQESASSRVVTFSIIGLIMVLVAAAIWNIIGRNRPTAARAEL